MLSSPIVTSALSIIFIIFVFSMMASLALEYYTKLTKQRAKLLLSCLSQNLRDPYINQVDFSLLVYSHPLVSGLKEDKDNIPSYIASDVFATALIDVVINYGVTYSFEFDDQATENKPTAASPVWVDRDPFNDFNRSLLIIKQSGVRTLFETFAVNAQNYNDLKKNIMVWYDHYMDRVTGYYKKKIGNAMICISAGIVLLFNVDMIHIMKSLEENTTVNSYIAATAQNYASANKGTNYDSVTLKQVAALEKITDSIGLPVGYKFKDNGKGHHIAPDAVVVWDRLKKQAKDDGGVLILLLGWLISTIAISKGAPFWFDLLSKVANVRMAGAKPSSTTSGKKDSDG